MNPSIGIRMHVAVNCAAAMEFWEYTKYLVFAVYAVILWVCCKLHIVLDVLAS